MIDSVRHGVRLHPVQARRADSSRCALVPERPELRGSRPDGKLPQRPAEPETGPGGHPEPSVVLFKQAVVPSGQKSLG